VSDTLGVRHLLAVGALSALLVVPPPARTAASPICKPRPLSTAYSASVQQAVASGRDLWGEQLLRAPGGPTLAGARSFLKPLSRAVQWYRQPLTPTGSYYVPLSFPFSAHGSTVFALHVADGSGVMTRSVDGPSLSVYVGAGGERYGSCAARAQPARLAGGYLPILETAYIDANGVRYRQESFVGRALSASSVVSFVRLTVDARQAREPSFVRLAPWRELDRVAPARLGGDGKARLIVSSGANVADGTMRWRVPAGSTRTIYAEWLHAPSAARYLHATPRAYDAARAVVARFWRAKLAAGATFSVPEPAVENAERGVLTQLLAYGWRYSIGNQYEELSYAESLDAAEVAAQYGYPSVARSIIELALQRMHLRPWRFTAFRGAHILSTAALYVRLTDDRSFLQTEGPALNRIVARIAERQLPNGRLHPEPLSTDLEDQDVDSVSGQVEAVQGLRAIGDVWASAGDGAPAARASALARSIDKALRPAVGESAVQLRDGSVFLPSQLSTPQAPFRRVTATRESSYWNLVMPYAFSSGWFTPAQSRGIARYLDTHGARLLGLPRTSARTVYLRPNGAGVAPAYALGAARFLANSDRPDRQVLSLYGLLAIGMTPRTYVSGEAVSVLPVAGKHDRMMLMPPNTGSNASYLGTLRELLVHEGKSLDLAFATPRAWLEDGRAIRVRNAPTSHGKVSYSIVRRGRTIEARLTLPRVHARLRLRLPGGRRLERVRVDGAPAAADRAGTIDLGTLGGALVVRATVGSAKMHS
jgi:hypothetical protein